MKIEREDIENALPEMDAPETTPRRHGKQPNSTHAAAINNAVKERKRVKVQGLGAKSTQVLIPGQGTLPVSLEDIESRAAHLAALQRKVAKGIVELTAYMPADLPGEIAVETALATDAHYYIPATQVPQREPDWQILGQACIDYMGQGRTPASYAAWLGVREATIFTWCKRSPVFALAYDIAQQRSLSWLEETARRQIITGSGNGATLAMLLRNRFPTYYPDEHSIKVGQAGDDVTKMSDAELMELIAQAATIAKAANEAENPTRPIIVDAEVS